MFLYVVVADAWRSIAVSIQTLFKLGRTRQTPGKFLSLPCLVAEEVELASNVAYHLRYCFQNAGVDRVIIERSNMLNKGLGHFDRLLKRIAIDEASLITVWPITALLRE